MNILAVDTSSQYGSVTVCADGKPLGEVRLSSSVQYSDRLFRSIDFLFSQVDLELDNIDVFAAARGPGSFTGIRVGLAAMQGFAAAHEKRAVGVCTLAALAWRTGTMEGAISPVLDARREEAFCALYERQEETLIELRKPVIATPERWLSTLVAKRILFCGNVVSQNQLPNERLGSWKISSVKPYLATAVAEMVEASHEEDLVPLYVRKADAEVKRLEGNAH